MSRIVYYVRSYERSVTRSIQEQLERAAAMNTFVNGVCLRQDALALELQRLAGYPCTSNAPNRIIHTRMSRIAKIEFPKFHGDDPTSWMYRCNQFFKVDDIVEEDRVTLASMHLPKPVYNNAPYRQLLTQKELDDKRAKNQCFYCDQKYVPGHKCSGKLFSLEIVEMSEELDADSELQLDMGVFGLEDNVVENEQEEQHDGSGFDAQPQISLNAISGTHDFLDISIAKQFGCPIKQTYPLQVSGNNSLTSVHECKGLTWKLQGETFKADIMLIPLGGCEMVLGMQWLVTLGDIKDAIEVMVKELLDNGVIRARHGPFSSPIVMIKEMQEWPVNVKKLIGFRLTGYYRRIKASWVTDPSIQQIITALQTDLVANSKFSWQQGQLRRNGKLSMHCQSHKLDLAPYRGLLQPLSIPTKSWTDIYMDFIKDLPRKTVILVVVDRLRVTLQLSTTYHPQTDGQTVVVNRCLECYLRCMTSEQPKEWVNWLSLAEFWYNTNHHTSINTTPFEVVYGQKPPTHVSYMAGDSNVEAVDRSILAREAAISLLKFHLERGHHRMKEFTDKHMIHDVFHVSQLKPFKGQPANTIPLPHCTTTGCCFGQKDSQSLVYWLVQWSNGSQDDATCEVATQVQTKYAEFDADS
nr:hypothetical protein [Tanacetum cinerariifolium]